MTKNTARDHGNIFSLLMFISARSLLVLYMYKFVLNLLKLLFYFPSADRCNEPIQKNKGWIIKRSSGSLGQFMQQRL